MGKDNRGKSSVEERGREEKGRERKRRTRQESEDLRSQKKLKVGISFSFLLSVRRLEDNKIPNSGGGFANVLCYHCLNLYDEVVKDGRWKMEA